MLRVIAGVSFFVGLPLMTAPVAAVENPDTHFYERAAQANLAEIDGGMLAQQRGESPAVKNFGQMMVKDHTSANLTLRDLATANQVELPTQPSADQRAKRLALQALTGNAFDRVYIEGQILLHRDAIALFKEESASGDDLAARHFAADTLPTLQAHLKILMAMPVIEPPPPPPPPTLPAEPPSPT